MLPKISFLILPKPLCQTNNVVKCAISWKSIHYLGERKNSSHFIWSGSGAYPNLWHTPPFLIGPQGVVVKLCPCPFFHKIAECLLCAMLCHVQWGPVVAELIVPFFLWTVSGLVDFFSMTKFLWWQNFFDDKISPMRKFQLQKFYHFYQLPNVFHPCLKH